MRRLARCHVALNLRSHGDLKQTQRKGNEHNRETTYLIHHLCLSGHSGRVHCGGGDRRSRRVDFRNHWVLRRSWIRDVEGAYLLWKYQPAENQQMIPRWRIRVRRGFVTLLYAFLGYSLAAAAIAA